MLNDTVNHSLKSTNLPGDSQNVPTNSHESPLFSEVQKEIGQDQKTASAKNNQPQYTPPPPSSFVLRFAKRVAICTAVVALARYAYPKLLVLG